MDVSRQFFAWTGPTPVGVGYASFLQAFDLDGLIRIQLRGGDGVQHYIDIPRESAKYLGSLLSELK